MRGSSLDRVIRGGCAFLLALALAISAQSCGEEETAEPSAAPAKPAKKKEQAATKKSEPGPDTSAPKPSEYAYSPIGKRDPFRTFIADMREAAQREDMRKPESTEKFELDQYRLTGVITGTSQPQAMVEDPESVGHVLRIGTRLGKNGGRVTRISATEIVVTEEYRAPTGERVRVPITLPLPIPSIGLLDE